MAKLEMIIRKILKLSSSLPSILLLIIFSIYVTQTREITIYDFIVIVSYLLIEFHASEYIVDGFLYLKPVGIIWAILTTLILFNIYSGPWIITFSRVVGNYRRRKLKTRIINQIDDVLINPSRTNSIRSAHLIYLPYLNRRLIPEIANIIHSYLIPPSRLLNLLYDDFKFYFDNWLIVDTNKIDEGAEDKDFYSPKLNPTYIPVSLGDGHLRFILPNTNNFEINLEDEKCKLILSNIKCLNSLSGRLINGNIDNSDLGCEKYNWEIFFRPYDNSECKFDLISSEKRSVKSFDLDPQSRLIEVQPFRIFYFTDSLDSPATLAECRPNICWYK